MSAPETPLSPLHDLLAAIVESLDVPQARFSDERAYHYLMESRALQLRGYLRRLVAERDEPDIHADGIRRMTADNPVTYTPYAPEPRQPDEGQP